MTTGTTTRPPRLRGVLALLLVLSIGALVVAVRADRAHGRIRVQVTTVSRNVHPAVSAADCPAVSARPCTFGLVDFATVQVVLDYFRPALLLDTRAYNPPSPTVRPPMLLVIRMLTTAGVTVSVTARCLGGGGAVRDSTPTSPLIGPAIVSVVDGRRPGCSVAVELDVPARTVVPLAPAVALAHDSTIAVAP